MTTSSLIVCGLPESGKTTFLAALWHLVRSKEINTKLALTGLSHGDYGYVTDIADVWLKGRRQERTKLAAPVQTVGMDLTKPDGAVVRLIFPDHSGESYSQMWEVRSCSSDVAAQIRNRSGVLLFINPSKIKTPRPLVDDVEMNKAFGQALPEDAAGIPWNPALTPDQVQIVDILQSLRCGGLGANDRKLAIFLSAWDLVEDQGLVPEELLRARMPLLDQYLAHGRHGWDVRIYGLSAQGGEYLSGDANEEPSESLSALLDKPGSERIRLLVDGGESHDLTEPLEWLTS